MVRENKGGWIALKLTREQRKQCKREALFLMAALAALGIWAAAFAALLR